MGRNGTQETLEVLACYADAAAAHARGVGRRREADALAYLAAELRKLPEPRALAAERLALARLAAEEPQFFNPVEAWEAKALRDRVLLAARPAAPGAEGGR